MKVLLFAENTEGNLKKAIFELTTYGRGIAGDAGELTAICAGNIDTEKLGGLGKYGADRVLHITENLPVEKLANAIAEAAVKQNAEVVLFANNYTGKLTAPRVAAALGASVAAGVVDYPDTGHGFKVRKPVFSGKAFAEINLTTPVKVLALTSNSVEIRENPRNCAVENYSPTASGVRVTESIEQIKATGKIPLTEAELVVSAGRGMKGPENWGMIEELASILGAATACSKPVSDMHWRPHEEHVGQTGITIKPNLYIAVGISGAIQHLAGVSSSKVIVAINKDPEAPFFKAADYGIVGDAFEVLPKIIEAAKKFKAVS